jgi:hypothetical protein
VSKWTSLHAIEEIYETDGNVQDSFLDQDDVHVHEAVTDLDLLLSRGEGLLQLVDELEESDDIASSSDAAGEGHDSNDSSDDGSHDQGGGGAGGSLGNVGNAERQGPDPSGGRPRADGKERREDSSNEPNDGSSPGMDLNLAASLRVTGSALSNSESRSLVSDTTTRPVKYGGSPAPTLARRTGRRFRDFPDPPTGAKPRPSWYMGFGDINGPSLSDESPRSGKATSRRATSGKATFGKTAFRSDATNLLSGGVCTSTWGGGPPASDPLEPASLPLIRLNWAPPP